MFVADGEIFCVLFKWIYVLNYLLFVTVQFQGTFFRAHQLFAILQVMTLT